MTVYIFVNSANRVWCSMSFVDRQPEVLDRGTQHGILSVLGEVSPRTTRRVVWRAARVPANIYLPRGNSAFLIAAKKSSNLNRQKLKLYLYAAGRMRPMKRCDCEVAVGENSGGRVDPLPCDLFVDYDRYDYMFYVLCLLRGRRIDHRGTVFHAESTGSSRI